MTSILFVIIGLSLLIIIHEWGHFLAARFFNLLVEEFGIGFPPRLFSKKIGETLYTLNIIPLGGFVKIYGENAGVGENIKLPNRSFAYQGAWRRAVIISAGVIMNFIFGWLIISIILFIGSPSIIMVEQVLPNSPALRSGLQVGDQILGYESADALIQSIDSHKGREMKLKIKRDQKELQFTATPRLNPPKKEGSLGVALRDGGIVRHGLLESVGKGFVNSVIIVATIFGSLYQAISSPQAIIGPVGIFDVAINTGQLGLIYLFQLLALISLNLVVLNILPIPALDGGRLLFILIEKIRGKKMSAKTETRANAIGFAFLIALILLITVKDIASLL